MGGPIALAYSKVRGDLLSGPRVLRQFGISLLVFILLLALPAATAQAASWRGVVTEIEKRLDQAVALYAGGKAEAAKDAVNQGYFGFYEEKGMESAVRLHIAAKRAATQEFAFSELKLRMSKGAPVDEVRAVQQKLLADLKADAVILDGGGSDTSTSTSDLIASFLIIAREGLEAILVLAALIAYLTKAGHTAQVRTVYQGALAALAASLVTAWVFRSLLQASGAAQEVLEGLTMLLAVVVLVLVSYWLFSKAQAQAWQSFIEGQLGASLSRGNRLALWWAAFLAVYREGAETVLFYQALLSGGGSPGSIVTGLVLGIAVLAVVFALVRWGSLRIPLRPFFAVTSLLLYYLAVVLAGKGVVELQAGGIVPLTPIAGAPTLDWAGVFPTVQSLTLQGILLLMALAAVSVTWLRRAPVSG